MSQVFAAGGQSIVVSTSASVLSMNTQDWFPLGLTDLISLQSKGFSRAFSSPTVQKHQFFSTQPPLCSSSHIHTWLLEKPWFWLDGPFLAKWHLWFLICCLGLSLKSRGITLLTKVCHSFPSKEQVSFNFMATVTISSDFGAQENKIC